MSKVSKGRCKLELSRVKKSLWIQGFCMPFKYIFNVFYQRTDDQKRRKDIGLLAQD